MTITDQNKNLAENSENEQSGNSVERRFGVERREYEYFKVIPERRSGNDRRNNGDKETD